MRWCERGRCWSTTHAAWPKHKARACQLPSLSTFGSRALEVLKGDMQSALKPLLEQVDQLGLQIAAYGAMLGKIAGQRYPEETKVLCSVPGVGILIWLTYVLTRSDAQRFAPSRDVAPVPGITAETKPIGRARSATG
jgi:transposase